MSCSKKCSRVKAESNFKFSDTQYDFNDIIDSSALGIKFADEPVGNVIACWGCKKAAGGIEGIIAKRGCLLADAAITGICEAAFLGPEDPLAEICAIAFIKACSTFAGWIAQKAFSPDKACHFIHMC